MERSLEEMSKGEKRGGEEQFGAKEIFISIQGWFGF